MPTDGHDSFKSIPALKAACRSAGNHFFSKGAMEFFNSRIESGMIRGQFFVTSEHRESSGEDDPTERLFTVRKVKRLESGMLSIDTVGEFQQFKTKIEAVNYASTVKEEDS